MMINEVQNGIYYIIMATQQEEAIGCIVETTTYKVKS